MNDVIDTRPLLGRSRPALGCLALMIVDALPFILKIILDYVVKVKYIVDSVTNAASVSCLTAPTAMVIGEQEYGRRAALSRPT